MLHTHTQARTHAHTHTNTDTHTHTHTHTNRYEEGMWYIKNPASTVYVCHIAYAPTEINAFYYNLFHDYAFPLFLPKPY